MGFPVDQFIKPNVNIREEFLCSICHDVLKNPIMLKKCQDTFCRDCCEVWRTESNTCPLDRENIEEEELQAAPRFLINLLEGLEMVCPFKAAGCASTIKLGEATAHEKRCRHNPENQKECVGGCGAVINQVEDKDHHCVSYLKKKLEDQAEELKASKNEVEKYRRKYGELGPGPSSAVMVKKIGNSAPPSAARATPRCIVPEPYSLAGWVKLELDNLVRAALKNIPRTLEARFGVEERLENVLNKRYIWKDTHGSNTFWRVCVIPTEKASSQPCPCGPYHGGANEHYSKHSGRCSGNEYRLLAKYTPETPNISTNLQVTLCHYVDFRNYKAK